jgi:hypothetical protein
MSGTLHEDLSIFYCSAALNGFIFLTVTCSSKILIVAFPLQQWLREHTTMLRYMYLACSVFIQMLSKWVNITDYYLPMALAL